MKKVFLTIFLTLNFSLAVSALVNSEHSSNPLDTKALHPKEMKWNFDGFFGSIDKQSAQRGYQVYKEICSSCHTLNLVAYRSLTDIGFSEDEVKQIAAEYNVTDGPNDDGEMFERPALPSDKIVGPYLNEKAARSANGGAYPPDFSLIVKARHAGPSYIYSLLNGYQEAPEGFPSVEGKYYNPYFEGRQIAMPAPITEDGQVEYKDGTFASKEQMTIDVVNFLQWAAEPETEARKKMGVRTMIFLLILLAILIAAKKAVWKTIK